MNRPEVSVVVPTHDRPDRLRALLRSLEAQDATTPTFEVVVVDDASGPETRAMLDGELTRAGLDLQVVRLDRGQGPAAARNAGWRRARGTLVAFTDDDCEATPEWLATAGAAWEARGDRVVQGRTEPNPAEHQDWNAFARTIVVREPGPPWETCNIFYPRELLARLGGFDETLPPLGGEDTELAWRAVLAGAEVRFEPAALVHHAVHRVGALGMLRYASHWHVAVPLYARHPGLRRRQLHRGIFWSPVHEEALLALLAIALPRNLWPVRCALAFPYLRRRLARRSGPILLPYLALLDLLEIAAMLRGSVRERVVVL